MANLPLVPVAAVETPATLIMRLDTVAQGGLCNAIMSYNLEEINRVSMAMYDHAKDEVTDAAGSDVAAEVQPLVLPAECSTAYEAISYLLRAYYAQQTGYLLAAAEAEE